MNKLLAGILGLFVVLWVVYPYMTLYQLNQAVSAQDEAALDRLINWDRVGRNLEADLEGVFDADRGDGSDDPMEQLAENLLGIFTDFIISPVVAFYMTPEGIAFLLNTQIILDDPMEVFQDDFPAEDTWYDHISFAFFSSPTTFFATVKYPEDRQGPKTQTVGTEMTLVLRFENFGWRLSRIRLPLDHISE